VRDGEFKEHNTIEMKEILNELLDSMKANFEKCSLGNAYGIKFMIFTQKEYSQWSLVKKTMENKKEI